MLVGTYASYMHYILITLLGILIDVFLHGTFSNGNWCATLLYKFVCSLVVSQIWYHFVNFLHRETKDLVVPQDAVEPSEML